MRTTTVLALAALLAAPVAAQEHGQHGQAQPERPRRPMMQGAAGHDGMGMPMMMEIHAYGPAHLLERREVLGLTDEQVQRLTQLQTQATSAHEAAREAAHQHMQQAQQAWNAGDAAGVTNHARLGMQSMQQAHLAMLESAAQARGVLTPEQRARVAGWTDMMRMQQGEMMQRREGMQQRMRERMEQRRPRQR